MTKGYLKGGLAAAAVIGLGVVGAARAFALEPYAGTRFSEVWSTVTSNRYTALPHQSVTASRMVSGFHSLIKDAAIRTLSDEHDTLPHFDKLVHSNGVCLAGTWNVTESSPYTGYFAQGSRGLVIARASVAFSDTTVGTYRGFGLALKLYPTTDPFHAEPLKTANLFFVDDLGGTKTVHYTEAEMTNEPPLSFHAETGFSVGAVGLFVIPAFEAADSHPQRRQVYPFSELGVSDRSTAKTPTWVMIKGEPGIHIDEADFRNELDVTRYGGSILFDVFTSEDRTKGWTKIGYLDFRDSVASDACDHTLHFHHPKFRNDLP